MVVHSRPADLHLVSQPVAERQVRPEFPVIIEEGTQIELRDARQRITGIQAE